MEKNGESGTAHHEDGLFPLQGGLLKTDGLAADALGRVVTNKVKFSFFK